MKAGKLKNSFVYSFLFYLAWRYLTSGFSLSHFLTIVLYRYTKWNFN